MEREELLRSNEYWITNIQIGLFEMIRKYLKENNLTKTQLAEKLGVTKGYISQILNGDGDHKISKLVELSLACNIAPVFSFVNLDEYVGKETRQKPKLSATSRFPKKSTRKIIVADSSLKKKRA